MSLPYPAFALLGEPHTGKPPRVVRVRVNAIYAWIGVAAVTETDTHGYSLDVHHVLHLAQVASLKTLADKTKAFSAPESRPPLTHSGKDATAVRGMTETGAANPQPQPEPITA